MKNQHILNDDASHFKLVRSVLKIASFKFVNPQYFNSFFMNLKIARLVLNVKCVIVLFTQCSRQRLFCDEQNIVHLLLLFICLQVMKKYLKYRNHTFKSTGFSIP